MSATLVNGHVMLTLGANWRTSPAWQREWQNEVSTSVVGQESRRAVRAAGRVSLSWRVMPGNAVELAELADQVRVAKKSGLAATPYWGRSAVLLEGIAMGDGECLVHGAWKWKAGDYLFLADETGNWEAVAVVSAAADGSVWTLELGDGIFLNSYMAGICVWPVLFGKFTAKDLAGATPEVGEMELTVRELVARDSAQVGTLPGEAGEGIGSWKVGTEFEVS